jgi:hypothetical protein
MTEYVKKLIWRNLPAALRWRYKAEAYYGSEITDSSTLALLAIDRLAHGDVTQTRFGVRVALRPDLDDDRSASGANAYWPEKGCTCWSMKTRRECSHHVAATLFKIEDASIWDQVDLQSYADRGSRASSTPTVAEEA